ncbi:MAG: hypothetical protein L6Q76_14170, partial [Polyangiaceae bacterium]|nr:hypothetical protein [Polyangiaceae bacterium]
MIRHEGSELHLRVLTFDSRLVYPVTPSGATSWPPSLRRPPASLPRRPAGPPATSNYAKHQPGEGLRGTVVLATFTRFLSPVDTPLPSVLPSTSRPTTARADGYGYVRFETNYYAAPGFHGQQVQLTVDDRLVRISSGTETIAEYKRSYARKRRIGSERLDRLEETMGRDRAARTGRNRLVAASPLMVSLFDHWLDEGRNIGSQIARALKLLELYGPGVFAWAVE